MVGTHPEPRRGQMSHICDQNVKLSLYHVKLNAVSFRQQ